MVPQALSLQGSKGSQLPQQTVSIEPSLQASQAPSMTVQYSPSSQSSLDMQPLISPAQNSSMGMLGLTMQAPSVSQI